MSAATPTCSWHLLKPCFTREASSSTVWKEFIYRLGCCNCLQLPRVPLMSPTSPNNLEASSRVRTDTISPPDPPSLHWLLVRINVDFNILQITSGAWLGLAPGYITKLIPMEPAGIPRSSDEVFLVVLMSRLTEGGWAFKMTCINA